MQEALPQILVVDDDVKVLSGFQTLLGKKYHIRTERTAAGALAWLKLNPMAAVVVSCFNIPDMPGGALLRAVQEAAPNAARILLSDAHSSDEIMKALSAANVYLHLRKPVAVEEAEMALRSAVAYHRRIVKERNLLEKTLAGSVKLMIEMLSLFHADAFRKTSVLRTQALKVARAMDMKKTWELEMAVMLSPLGEALLPREILARYRSAKTLTDPQRELLARAPEQSRDLLKNIPQLDKVADVLYYSGRGYDGSGFPADGPVGADIPLNSRILKILIDLWYASPDTGVDLAAFEALNINRRQYDPALLTLVRECLLEDAEARDRERIVACHIRALHSGDVLVDDILTEGSHELVLSRGHQLTLTTIKRLAQFDRISGLRQPIRVRRREEIPAERVTIPA
ncbi:HD domain-containing phosphohydrolase [Polymorphum gilvum]|uniref:Response regulator receiver domain protein n=1 Tax=Polymorphum gilvum (strain LMG 25793 / CGMCC 1.9160 / SL003B-26A1) TaxID=991905 RepID=F2J113_POLGS|nr:HD domain-containing phosphohydrolase [Polymorphum gilvum]ADZ71959.1 Response regulator receiver domain protein [Polymorphum gilvum SL003B-26A1]